MKLESQNQKENIPDKATGQALEQAAQGLLYPSESDYPFTYVEWDANTADEEHLTETKVLQLVNKPESTPVKLLSLEDFFKNVTQIQDWYEDEEKADVERFTHLKQTLQDNLTDIQVFKIGEIEIDAYIIGKTPDNKWAGLSTVIIET